MDPDDGKWSWTGTGSRYHSLLPHNLRPDSPPSTFTVECPSVSLTLTRGADDMSLEIRKLVLSPGTNPKHMTLKGFLLQSHIAHGEKLPHWKILHRTARFGQFMQLPAPLNHRKIIPLRGKLHCGHPQCVFLLFRILIFYAWVLQWFTGRNKNGKKLKSCKSGTRIAGAPQCIYSM